jgi:hypothetical protein
MSELSGVEIMRSPTIALLAYCAAAGFILTVAFHSSFAPLITASVPQAPPFADSK